MKLILNNLNQFVNIEPFIYLERVKWPFVSYGKTVKESNFIPVHVPYWSFLMYYFLIFIMTFFIINTNSSSPDIPQLRTEKGKKPVYNNLIKRFPKVLESLNTLEVLTFKH